MNDMSVTGHIHYIVIQQLMTHCFSRRSCDHALTVAVIRLNPTLGKVGSWLTADLLKGF